jgi:hypothetical protein
MQIPVQGILRVSPTLSAARSEGGWLAKLPLHVIVVFAFALCSATAAQAQKSGSISSPPDTHIYSRAAIPGDTAPSPAAAPLGAPSVPATSTRLMRVFDVVVNNTDPTLKDTSFGGQETSIAVNPNNRNQITISAFSTLWNLSSPNPNASLWNSTDGGQTWTKNLSVPPPPGVPSGQVNLCPCDQTFDFGPNNVLFGTFLTDDGTNRNVYSGSTTDPANSSSWAWWLSAFGPALRTNLNAASQNHADQPWLLQNIGAGPGGALVQAVYVAYDAYNPTTKITTTRVSASIDAWPQFTSDQPTGNSGLAAQGDVNPGHRLAADPRNGWMYSLYQVCTAPTPDCNGDPKTISYMLNRSINDGTSWSLNGSSTGIPVVPGGAQSHQSTPKFGTVNALLGGIDHGAVDPSTGDLYYVYGTLSASYNTNNLAIRRIFDNGSGGVTVGAEHLVTNGGSDDCALPSVAVTNHGTIGVFFYCYNGIVSTFPQFTALLAVSTDQGASFSYKALKTFLSPVIDTGYSGQRVWGDYVQMKAIDNCFFGSFVANRAAFYGTTALPDPVFFKACYGQSASTHDASGDGFSDIVWHNTTNGQVVAWFVNGNSATTIGGGTLGYVASPWAIVGQRDFNGDGFSDILWRNGSTGQAVIWLLNGTSVIGGGSPGTVTADWSVAGTGDFNGDGFGDILWYNASTGQVVIWFLFGSTVLPISGSPGTAPSPWTIAGTGDFNGDGMTDILWYNTSTGQVLTWLLNGTTVLPTSNSPGYAASPWTIAGTGDFNGDGKWDILFRNNSTGQVVLWFLNGASTIGGGSLGFVGADWATAQTGDFNADGYSDILWYNSGTGQVLEWLLLGTTVLSEGTLGYAASPWQIQGMNSD